MVWHATAMHISDYAKIPGVTIAAIARRVSVSERMIRQYIARKALPSVVVALEIQRATNGAVRPKDWVVADAADADA